MELPWFIEVVPVIVQAGRAFMLSVLSQVLVVPNPSVTVTVRVPAEFTVMHCVVAPVLQR